MVTKKKAAAAHAEEAASAPPRPTLGHIVHVLPDDAEGNDVPMAAMVTVEPRDGEDRLHVCVFDPQFGPRLYQMTGYSDCYPPTRGCWAWPPRV